MNNRKDLKTLKIEGREDRLKLEERYNLVKGEDFTNGILFSLENKGNKDVVGKIALVKPTRNMFIKNGSGELEIAFMKINEEYKGEGIEAFLLEIAIAYAKKINKLLIARSNSFNNSFLERRGFKPEPVIHHQMIFVLGDNYLYNLENIEKPCYKFLDKDKIQKSRNMQIVDKELLAEVVELIVRIKKIANNLEYVPNWAKRNRLEGIELSSNLPEVPDFRDIKTLEELKDVLLRYISKVKILEILLNSLGIEREDKFFNELPLFQAEPFVHALNGIVLSKVLTNKVEGEKYFVCIYDLSDNFLPVGNNKELGKEIAEILAPATLYEEKEEKLEEILCI